MSENIYPIQLLNDLHNHFPDILYNPGQFTTVQDLLDYIRRVADVNPYTRGLRLYNSFNRFNDLLQPQHQEPQPSPQPSPQELPTNRRGIPSTTIRPTTTRSAAPLYSNSTIPQWIPLGSTNVINNDVPSEMDTIRIDSANIVSSLFGNILSDFRIRPSGLQSFLDQRARIVPTNTQINQATRIETVDTTQDDICTICQDTFETSQIMRRINHCNHVFHRDCIDVWFNESTHCPTCRHDIRDTYQDVSGNNVDNIIS